MFVVGLFRGAAAISLLAMGLGLPSVADAGVVCDAHLSAAQRARFQLAVDGCVPALSPLVAPLSMQADALVASAGLPPPAAELPARESAHLVLFGRPGVVMARIAEPAYAALPPAPPARPRAPSLKPTSTSVRAVGMAPQIDEVARRHDIDPLLLHAIAYVESRHNPAARSSAGARGVMQVMPATAQRFGVARADALGNTGTNLEVSATYLKTLQQRFGSDLPLVLAAYNAGEGAVERNGRRIPKYPETQDYVRQVLAQYRALTAAAKVRPAAVAASPF